MVSVIDMIRDCSIIFCENNNYNYNYYLVNATTAATNDSISNIEGITEARCGASGQIVCLTRKKLPNLVNIQFGHSL